MTQNYYEIKSGVDFYFNFVFPDTYKNFQFKGERKLVGGTWDSDRARGLGVCACRLLRGGGGNTTKWGFRFVLTPL